MSDAKYCIGKRHADDVEFIRYAGKYNLILAFTFVEGFKMTEVLPTYTVSELLYKLHEWEENNIGGRKCRGDVRLMPDAPYYMAFFHLVGDETVGIYNDMCGMSESPIEGLASLLIQCHKKDIGMKAKDTGDISDK